MPMYTFKCKECGHDHSELLSFEAYDNFTSAKCEKCDATLTKDDRNIGQGLHVNVIGQRKGFYNSLW